MKLTDKIAAMKTGMVFEDNDPRGPRRRVCVVGIHVAGDSSRVSYVRCAPTGQPTGDRIYTAKLASFFRGGSRGFSLAGELK